MIYRLKRISIWNKLHIDVILLFFILLLLTYSILIGWSASGQNIKIIENKIIQIIIGLIVMVITAQITPRSYEISAPYLYFLCILLLALVEFFGEISKGAQRWLNIGIIRFQPSEIAKIAVPLMIGRFIYRRNIYPPSLSDTIIVLFLILIPSLLVSIQPDLGTAALIIVSGLFVLFLSGLSWITIGITILLVSILILLLWFFLMHDYQRDRVAVMLDPEIDPLGAGYHIIQSKIAIGSGGLFGKGWLCGSQSQLEFLPERHTDFVFSVLGEEMGLVGGLVLLSLYFGIIIRGLTIAIQAKNAFSRIIVSSWMLVFFTYVFINIGMVSGLLPVVGVPLPLISYGGSSLIVLMTEFGIIMSISTHQKILSKAI
ncbi:rod shape-determining protein RodA [Sodalis sp. CWE]|uniref:rod shape-determining protein RodA n=1 Tax=Sodalis sp. CWE TaxID=2803816 RepID=UPI001C7E13FD|nr:rod shape-determining protein RodA [Sodalis sp. CWE]MBX4180926.1 rod shape-determining protein RodA [Sodalis sp. CWE]